MARPLRIEFAGSRYHVINRGNNRRRISEGNGAANALLSSALCRCLLYGYVVLCFCGGPVALVGQGSGQSRSGSVKADASALAAETYELVKELPGIGIEQGDHRIRNIIRAADYLLTDNSSSGYQCSLAVREAIAHALVYEMYRSEAERMNIQQQDQPRSIPFEKQTLVRLWKANMPKEGHFLAQIKNDKGVIMGFHSSKGFTDEDVLRGKQFDEMPREVREEFRELRRKAHNYSLHGRMETPDELFAQTIINIQTLRDLDDFVHVYEKAGLPKDREKLKSAVDEVLREKHERRIDDGMKLSSLKALSTFGKYCSESNQSYLLQQAMLLGPYLNDTTMLPEQIQSYLSE